MDSKIVATVTGCKQVGPDDFVSIRDSRVFSTDRPIKDLILFAENMGLENATINDVSLSVYTGESS